MGLNHLQQYLLCAELGSGVLNSTWDPILVLVLCPRNQNHTKIKHVLGPAQRGWQPNPEPPACFRGLSSFFGPGT